METWFSIWIAYGVLWLPFSTLNLPDLRGEWAIIPAPHLAMYYLPKLPERFGILYAVSGVSAPVEPKSTLRSLAV